MIPLRDQIRSHRTPIFNYLFLGVNIVIFAVTYFAGEPAFEKTIQTYGLIPFQITRSLTGETVLDLFSSMFLHGSILHLAGNMLYLWIFGDNVEDAMGHIGYALFYLLGGMVATLAHVLANPFSTIPTVGASGAIAAVLGAYLVLYPGARIQTLIPLGIFTRITIVPAIVVLGFWFVFELFQGFMNLGTDPNVGGVAFWAHIGGFIAGALMARVFAYNPNRYGGPSIR